MSHKTYKHNIVMSNYSTHKKYYKEFAVVARQEVDISFRYLWTVRKIKKMGRNILFFFGLIVWFERIWKKRNLFSICVHWPVCVPWPVWHRRPIQIGWHSHTTALVYDWTTQSSHNFTTFTTEISPMFPSTPSSFVFT